MLPPCRQSSHWPPPAAPAATAWPSTAHAARRSRGGPWPHASRCCQVMVFPGWHPRRGQARVPAPCWEGTDSSPSPLPGAPPRPLGLSIPAGRDGTERDGAAGAVQASPVRRQHSHGLCGGSAAGGAPDEGSLPSPPGAPGPERRPCSTSASADTGPRPREQIPERAGPQSTLAPQPRSAPAFPPAREGLRQAPGHPTAVRDLHTPRQTPTSQPGESRADRAVLRGWERVPRGCTRTPGEAADTREVHSRGASGCPSPGVRVLAHGVAVPALQPRVPPRSAGRVAGDPRGHLRESAEAHHPSALPLAEVTGDQKSTPHVMRSGHPPRKALGGPGTNTWGTRMRPNSAPAGGSTGGGRWAAPPRGSRRATARAAGAQTCPTCPTGRAGAQGRGEGVRARVPRAPAVGSRLSLPRQGTPSPPRPSALPAAGPGSAPRLLPRGGRRSGFPPSPPQSRYEPPPRSGAAGRLGRALSPAGPARTHRARGGDQPPGRRCPASPPLPAAPRRPPPPRRGGALAGAGAAPPAPTPAAAPGAAPAVPWDTGPGPFARRGAVPAAAGGRTVRGSDGSILLPSPLPVSNSSRRHLTGGAGTGTDTGTPISTGTRIPAAIPTRTAAAPGLRPAQAPGPPWEQDGTGIPPTAGAAARPASAPAPAGTRTAAELPRKLAPRRERHRDPRRHPTPAAASCTPADPRAGGRAGGPADRPADRPVSGAPCPDSPVQRGQDGHTNTPGEAFNPSRSAPGSEPHGDPTPAVGGQSRTRGDPAGMGWRAGSGPSRPRRDRPASHAPRAAAGHPCAWRSRPAAPEEESGLPPARALHPGPPRRGRPPPGSLPLPSPCLPPPGPPLAPGTWGPAGESSRARASPYVTARGPPRPSRGSRVLLANVPNPGAASARPRFTRAPLAGAGLRDASRARRAPRGRPSWPRGPRAPGRAARPGVPRAVSPAPAALRRLGAVPRAYATPRLERGQRLGRRLCRGCTPGPRWPVGSAPTPGTQRGFNLLPAAR
ncbi:collagen alpha-1(I) chain-like [Chiroxiphia lanceolata]|uniref:collagen alpha-1(I) chain-like n=1 Tax=Chiroxiphia lanceolata TaxID=296741 RepID=UPI0013CEC332|nr:collagen alpha-1(I) chain-like [Chiroxiphia lanceolata]